ncbi:uncharacterized protein BDR25DRAFT_314595 [Lindgomyces ingoldianus]|uniref:Uncharacterized protein n=1 Tax=Lindgomyces ingoldianus TaxID=673940 RepID=A0ACB6QU27_9PLEO|nr:uncharacterized protein BDR25DRAFT_314595 [Lindgomyces ingoldianus]KAF2470385.1 hypothetical protein BDR25DRAFT_314595 [Lindgomyces ingoldianus]
MDNPPPNLAVPPVTPKEFLTALREPGPDRLQVAASLLDRGADINGLYEFHVRGGKGGPIVPREQVTALFDAAKRGDYEAVQFLLGRGADIRARNLTVMGMHIELLPFRRAIETLCGLDGMRTSKERRIVELAEERFGVETDEDYVRRRDAFDGLRGYYMRNTKTGVLKPNIKRVKSVLKKNNAKRIRANKGNRHEQKRHLGALPSSSDQTRSGLAPSLDLPSLVFTI